jgi:hypothetical protein
MNCACNTLTKGKTEALQAWFRDHTDAIFKRHNMKSVGYWVPEDEPASQNMFIYILEHLSRQEAEKNWPPSKPIRNGKK